jgi:hypothetical protein
VAASIAPGASSWRTRTLPSRSPGARGAIARGHAHRLERARDPLAEVARLEPRPTSARERNADVAVAEHFVADANHYCAATCGRRRRTDACLDVVQGRAVSADPREPVDSGDHRARDLKVTTRKGYDFVLDVELGPDAPPRRRPTRRRFSRRSRGPFTRGDPHAQDRHAGWSVYSLRHYAITNWLRMGIPVHVVQRMAGHTSLSTTEHYAHSSRRTSRTPRA